MSEKTIDAVVVAPSSRMSLLNAALLAAGLLAITFVGVQLFDNPLTKPQTGQAHAMAKAKEEVQRRFNEGVVMLHAKQYDHALTAFHRVLEIDPKMPEAHVNIGFALLGLGQAKAAADFFDTATILRPGQLNAYYGLGEALGQLGDKLGALQSMETYLHRTPADDPYRMKAEAAVWELRAALDKEKADAANAESGKTVGRNKK